MSMKTKKQLKLHNGEVITYSNKDIIKNKYKQSLLEVNNATEKKLGGVDYLIVEAVAIREKVMNGILYSANLLQNMSEGWNGVPVPVNHPTNDNGEDVSANSPEVITSSVIGNWFHTQFSQYNRTLKGQIWINIKKAEELGYQNILQTFRSDESMDVSVGLLAELIAWDGEYNGERFDYIAIDIRPDHVALLPNDEGACSRKDGCGANIETNCKGGKCDCDNCKQEVKLMGDEDNKKTDDQEVEDQKTSDDKESEDDDETTSGDEEIKETELPDEGDTASNEDETVTLSKDEYSELKLVLKEREVAKELVANAVKKKLKLSDTAIKGISFDTLHELFNVHCKDEKYKTTSTNINYAMASGSVNDTDEVKLSKTPAVLLASKDKFDNKEEVKH